MFPATYYLLPILLLLPRFNYKQIYSSVVFAFLSPLFLRLLLLLL